MVKSSVLATTAFLLITAQSSGFCQTLPVLGGQASETKSQNAQGLSIQQAIQNALTQNPMMQQSQAMIDQAQGAIQEASGNRLPQLDLSFGGMASNNALNVFGMKLNQGQATFNDFGVEQYLAQSGFLSGAPTPEALAAANSTPPDSLNHPGWHHNFQTSLKLSVPIYNGGKISGMKAQAEALLRAAQSGDRAAKQQLILQVVTAYAGIDAAHAFVKVTQQAVEAAKSYRDLSNKMYLQGVVSKSDLLKSEVNLGDIRLRHQQALDQLANAKDALRIVMGVPRNQQFEINDLIRINKLSGTLEEARNLALRNNPQILAMDQQIDAARSGVSSARSVYKPHVNLMAQQDWNSENLGIKNDSYTVGAVLNWKILDFGARSGQVDRAVAGLNATQSKQQMAINTLMSQVGETWRAAQLAEYRLELKKLAISQSEEATRLEKLRYAQGISTMTNLLQTQAELDKSRAEFVQAQYELILQRATLLLTTGQLEPDAISATPLTTQSSLPDARRSAHAQPAVLSVSKVPQ
ncbi:MAG: TolC family protein [Halothiobacillus sp.]|nr:TolC family protein [Halothiobacillus sp.]